MANVTIDNMAVINMEQMNRSWREYEEHSREQAERMANDIHAFHQRNPVTSRSSATAPLLVAAGVAAAAGQPVIAAIAVTGAIGAEVYVYAKEEGGCTIS